MAIAKARVCGLCGRPFATVRPPDKLETERDYVTRGGSLVKLQAILGHASIRTTQVYAHLAPDHLAGATRSSRGSESTHGQRTHLRPRRAFLLLWYKYAAYLVTAAYPSG